MPHKGWMVFDPKGDPVSDGIWVDCEEGQTMCRVLGVGGDRLAIDQFLAFCAEFGQDEEWSEYEAQGWTCCEITIKKGAKR